jgi:hypothetical protein
MSPVRRLLSRLLAVPLGAFIASLLMFAALHFLQGDPAARETHQWGRQAGPAVATRMTVPRTLMKEDQRLTLTRG